MTTKRCTHCGKEKPLECWTRRAFYCRECIREKAQHQNRTRYDGTVREGYVPMNERGALHRELCPIKAFFPGPRIQKK